MLHTNLEETLTDICPICGTPHHALLTSVFAGSSHYLSGRCTTCGYVIDLNRSDSGMVLRRRDEAIEEDFRVSHLERTRIRARIFDAITGEEVTAAKERAAQHARGDLPNFGSD